MFENIKRKLAELWYKTDRSPKFQQFNKLSTIHNVSQINLKCLFGAYTK